MSEYSFNYEVLHRCGYRKESRWGHEEFCNEPAIARGWWMKDGKMADEIRLCAEHLSYALHYPASFRGRHLYAPSPPPAAGA